MMAHSVDPGNFSGFAWWSALSGHARLSGCLVIDVEREGFGSWGHAPGSDLLIIEHPVLERGDLKNPARALALAKDLAGVNVIEGQWIQAIRPRELVQHTPATWKRQVPKGIMNARILEKLDERERRLVRDLQAKVGAKVHNAIDAIGVGLFEFEKRGFR